MSSEKYGPTAVYGVCETADCDKIARATCDTCDGHFCYGHMEHPVHGRAAASSKA